MRRGRADLERSQGPRPAASAAATVVARARASEGVLPPGRGAGWLVPAAISLALLAILGPRDLVRATTPAGFDMAGHVYPLWRAVRHTLPAGYLHGWDGGWFAGFPFYFFYFPLCALLVAALTPTTFNELGGNLGSTLAGEFS